MALLFALSSRSYLLVPRQSVVRVGMEGRDGKVGEGGRYRARASRLNIYHDTCSVKRDMLQEPDEARRTVYQQHVCACVYVRACLGVMIMCVCVCVCVVCGCVCVKLCNDKPRHMKLISRQSEYAINSLPG